MRWRSAALDAQQNGIAVGPVGFGDDGFQIGNRRHLVVIGREDDVAPAKTLAARIGVGIHRSDDQTLQIWIDAKLPGDSRREVNDLKAEFFGNHAAVLAFGHFFLGVGIEHLLLAQFLVTGTATNCRRYPAALAIAQQHDRHARAGLDIGHKIGQRLVRRDVLPVDADDDVAGTNASLGSGGTRFDRLDQLALIARQGKRCGQIVVDRLDAHAQIAAFDFQPLRQPVDNGRGNLGGNGEADAHAAARRREDRVVDADHIAFHVEQRTARIAAIDAGIGLDVTVIGTAGIGGAIDGGNDARSHRTTKTEGVADGDDPVTHARLAGIAEIDEGERRPALDLQHRKVARRVIADQFRRIFRAVGHGDGNLFHRAAPGRADDMVVRHDEAVGGDDEAGTERLRLTRLRLLRLALASAIAEQAFERRSGKGVLLLLHLDPLAGGDVDHGRLQLFRQIGETCRRPVNRDGPVDHVVRIAGHLRAGRLASHEGDGGAAHQQRGGQSISISHRLHVLYLPSICVFRGALQKCTRLRQIAARRLNAV